MVNTNQTEGKQNLYYYLSGILEVLYDDDEDDFGEDGDVDYDADDDDVDHDDCDLNFVCNSGQESALSLALPEQTNSKTNFDDWRSYLLI